jgi:ABC-type phosphate/phosphonate transport system substrate-binding protein
MASVANISCFNQPFFNWFSIFFLTISSIALTQEKDYKLLFSANLLQNMKIEDAIATTKILAKKIQQKMKLEEDINILVTENISDILNEIKQPFDFILATSVETDLVKRKQNIEPVLVNETNGSFGFEYYLIVNNSSGHKNLSSLKGGTISILSKSEYHTAPIWLDKLLRDEKLATKEKFFKEIKYDYKANNVVLPVFFNKLDAAIISKPTFEILSELNPQLKKQLKILLRSDNLIFGVISFDGRSKDKKRKEFMLDVLKTLHEENYGKQLLNLFTVEKIIPIKYEYWQKYLDLYN